MSPGDSPRPALSRKRERVPDRIVSTWLAVGWVAVALLPWHALEDGVFAGGALAGYPWSTASAPALFALARGQAFLSPLLLPLVAASFRLAAPLDAAGARLVVAGALAGLLWLFFLMLAIGLNGWNFPALDTVFGALPGRQAGLGWGALLYAGALLALLCRGLAARGWLRGDVFALAALAAVVALVGVFVLFPLAEILATAFRTPRGAWAPELFWRRLSAPALWVAGGIVWSTLLLGLLTAASSTLLATAFALVASRTRLAGSRILGVVSVLPIITPPFVIGLAVILLFGRAGAVNAALETLFGIAPSRWIYGLQGVWFAQTLAFTPIAYLVLIGIVQGASPTLEEAAQTLRASPRRVFTSITLPLIGPGLVNAFLVAFVESLSDFGNPLVLGGDLSVLSTAIYFAIVGARADPGQAAVLGLLLLAFMLVAFAAQRRLLAGRSFTTIAGRGDGGLHPPLPSGVRRTAFAIVLPWMLLTAVVYGMILFGGFVENWGLRNVFTLHHYATAFAIQLGPDGLAWSGVAWPSLFNTVSLAGAAAPLSAALAMVTAYLLARQRFRGKAAFEAMTMFASGIPGTVLGIAFIMAFNTPPIELTYTAAIIVLSYVFRNLGTSVRAGIAALTQIDRSLDEASLTMRASGFQTLRRVILPLLRPALVAALVYGFVRAMTSVSAVIFLAGPDYMLSTVYIVNRAESGDYGVAIAYSSALILIMLAAIGLIRLAVGERVLGRRAAMVPAARTAAF
jgi:iron(III) transport system permease protein